MKNIRETLKGTQGLLDFIREQQEGPVSYEPVDEGLKDIWNKLKKKFKQVTDFLFGWVARLSSKHPYWCPVDEDGNIMPAISPLTMCQAYVDGYINKATTLICAYGRKAKSLTGINTKPKDAEKLYGPGNSLDYWKRSIRECEEREGMPINEVKLKNSDPQAKYNVVDTPDLKKYIKLCLMNPKLPRLLIMGAPGIGKTAILNTVLQEIPGGKEYSLIVKTLSNETPENFTLPKYTVDDYGQDRATDIPKTWMPVYMPTGDPVRDQELDMNLGKGLMFIDELSRSSQQVLNVILGLVNEGVFNGWKLGSGWQIICASNRTEDETPDGQTRIGNALASRFNIVYYEPTVKSWSEWAKTQGYMSPLLLSWLALPESENMSGGKYFYWDPNEENDDDNESMIICNPRQWTNAMRTLAAFAETADLEGFKILDIPKPMIGMALNGYIPAEAVDSFLAFLDVIGSVGDFDRVVRDVWKGGGSMSIDSKTLRKVALPLSQLIITAHKDKYPTEDEFNNLCDWLVKQNSDQMATYVLDILQNVFAGMVDPAKRSIIFVFKKKMEMLKQQEDPESYEDIREIHTMSYRAFFDKWGFDIDTVPDWSEGLAKLSKKYGATFAKYEVDGAEAFG